jgi:hypothetical protein
MSGQGFKLRKRTTAKWNNRETPKVVRNRSAAFFLGKIIFTPLENPAAYPVRSLASIGA